ncbi:MAG TPA: 30S ribosomal protein S1, partial [Parasegetibacter sp.]
MDENQIVNSNAEQQENVGANEQSGAATSTATTNEPAATPVATQFDTPHDDFDWSVDKRNVSSYTEEEKQKYDKVYDDTFKVINDNEMVKGIV